jgi:hypothetical protein
MQEYCTDIFCFLIKYVISDKLRVPTAEARVGARFRSCGICGGQSGAGTGFLRVLQFPLPIFIPQVAPQSPSSIIWSWYNRPIAAAVPSGLSLTPPRIIIIIIII